LIEMLDLSFAGLIGAFIGTVVAAFVYGPLVAAMERRLRARRDADEQEDLLAREASLLRRAVLAADVAVFAGVGYWLAGMIAG
jgi:hypothetical protein